MAAERRVLIFNSPSFDPLPKESFWDPYPHIWAPTLTGGTAYSQNLKIVRKMGEISEKALKLTLFRKCHSRAENEERDDGAKLIAT
uniref:Uncharacterized protein n=1 Tax=Romanomermis culicivorax TaxID=13658 RepID=A0A915IJP3_ROMCU